jgi:hypothetical protein
MDSRIFVIPAKAGIQAQVAGRPWLFRQQPVFLDPGVRRDDGYLVLLSFTYVAKLGSRR